MVYLTEHIKRMKAELAENNLASLAYFYAKDKEGLKTVNTNNFSDQELIAAKGYLSVAVTETETKHLNKPAYKGVDITSTIYKLLGAYLAVPQVMQKRLEQKFNETTFRNQFLISRCVPEYEAQFLNKIDNDPGGKSPGYFER